MATPVPPFVLIAEPLDPVCVQWLAQRTEVLQAGVESAGFADALARANALVVRTYVRVDSALLAAAPRLRVVGRAGVGLDNIDLPACAARGVRVVSTPGANTRAVVEFVLAAMLDAVRPRPTLRAPLDRAQWEAHRATQIGERELGELTLGILGLGRIGSSLAHVATALGTRVLYHDLREIPEPQRAGALPVSRDELLASADILSLHVDGRPQNRGIFGAVELARLKPDALLINTSRGFVVQADPLATWLRDHPQARVLLDVHEPEPFDASYPLLGLANAHLTAHLASGTRTAKRNMSWVVREVWESLQIEHPA